jgi:hypothetical protein
MDEFRRKSGGVDSGSEVVSSFVVTRAIECIDSKLKA